jgi:hypothetical protein
VAGREHHRFQEDWWQEDVPAELIELANFPATDLPAPEKEIGMGFRLRPQSSFVSPGRG